MKYILYLSTLLLFVLTTSCGDCGLSIEIGEFNILDETREFFVYQDEDILTFVDQDGGEHVLSVRSDKSIEETRMIVRTLCDEGTFDKQHEYYRISREQISFQDETGRQIFFLDLKTAFEDNSNLDLIGVYDHLFISGTFPFANNFPVNFNIITGIHQNTVSAEHRNDFLQEAIFIGDTILLGSSYTQVYAGYGVPESTVYYSKNDGIVLVYSDENNYWKLKN